MITLLTSGFITAGLSLLGKLVTKSFFEVVLKRIVIWSGEKLVPMTGNTLDDEIFEEIKKRLNDEN